MWWNSAANTVSATILLGALQSSDQGNGAKSARLGKILARLVGILLLLLFLALYVGIVAYALWRGWQSGGDSFFSWFSLAPALTFLFVPGAMIISLTRFRDTFPKRLAVLRRSSNSIREALALNDDQLMPRATLQPATLTPNELDAREIRIGPLSQMRIGQPAGASVSAMVALIVMLPVLLLVPLFTLLFDLPGEDFDSLNVSALNLPLTILLPAALFVPILLLIVFGVILAWLRMRPRSLSVLVDAQGIKWQRPSPNGNEIHIPWQRVRSISRLVYNAAYTGFGGYNSVNSAYLAAGLVMSSAYIIEAPEGVLLWVIGPHSKPEEVVASELLLRNAVTRTGKQLRDLTGFATEIAQAGNNVGYMLANRLPGVTNSSALAEYVKPEKRGRGRTFWPWFVGAIYVIVIGALIGAAVWVQRYQPTYLAHLPEQIHAEKPLLHDDLAQPDGAWIEHAPDNDDYRGYAYVNGGYQLSGNKPGWFVATLYPYQTYHDAIAIEVDVTLSGTPQKGGGDGAGIVFNSSSGEREFMIFTVTHAGRWQIYHYKYVDDNASDNWTYVASGHSDAIHVGTVTTNHLLLVVRGHQFLIYINGQFVESYTARYLSSRLPSFGYAGLYLDDDSLVAIFQNFNVYQMKTPRFPEWRYV